MRREHTFEDPAWLSIARRVFVVLGRGPTAPAGIIRIVFTFNTATDHDDG